MKTTAIEKMILAYEKQTLDSFSEYNNKSFSIRVVISFKKGLINPK
jgi:hypothetical protein